MGDFSRQHLDQPSNVGGSDFGSRKDGEQSNGRPSPGANFKNRHEVVPSAFDGKFGEKWGMDAEGKFEKRDTSN